MPCNSICNINVAINFSINRSHSHCIFDNVVFLVLKDIICFHDLIQSATVSNKKSCVQFAAGSKIHDFLTVTSVDPSCLKYQVLPVHVRKREHLGFFIHCHDHYNRIGSCNLPRSLERIFPSCYFKYRISSSAPGCLKNRFFDPVSAGKRE